VRLITGPSIDALRAELREYFAELVTPRVRAALDAEGPSWGPTARALFRRMGADGWLGIGWPVEHGGRGRGPEAQFVFFDEAFRAGAPLSLVTLNTVGPTLMSFGTDEQKARFLPGILAGEIVFAIGYSEPEAGTDLAALRTRAARDGGDWVVNGHKIFTSDADGADWVWLAVRTDPDAARHAGLSILLIPTDAEGFSYTPIRTLAESGTTATYYDDVRVPAGNLVGAENDGWALITHQLNHERVALAAMAGMCEETFDAVLAWACGPNGPGGRRPADEEWVGMRLAEAYARLRAVRLMNWRLVSATAAGSPDAGDASAVKVFGTETAVAVYRLLAEVGGPAALIRGGHPGALVGGRLERMNRRAQINTFGGGVNEVQREIVAASRLGMRRAPRRQGA
jgi:alkylation response protein AidB-like acyl-CoA dehydrogenase